MSSAPPVPLTVYFDGACPVCSREIAFYRRQAGALAIEWVDAAICPVATLGADLSREAALARLHVRKADGELTSGARAFTMLWRSIPRTAFLGRLLDHRPVLALLEMGYRVHLLVRRAWRGRGA
jgi:predicted DCC family thiol-disulfide oxidoreductase YuxK